VWVVDGKKVLVVLAVTLLSILHMYRKPTRHFKRESAVYLIPNTVSDAQILLSGKYITIVWFIPMTLSELK
jgi:hypothetical protein